MKISQLSKALMKRSNQAQLFRQTSPSATNASPNCATQKTPAYEYFFITCTNCGPRFTIIERLPYDRENTTMREFPFCGFCQKEYSDPANRRFHAQTVACPPCGPKAYLTTKTGEPFKHKTLCVKLENCSPKADVLAIKGYGGFHIASSVMLEAPLERLRANEA